MKLHCQTLTMLGSNLLSNYDTANLKVKQIRDYSYVNKIFMISDRNHYVESISIW